MKSTGEEHEIRPAASKRMTKNLIILTELERKDFKTVQNKEMFAGLRVLELASVLAGPSVGQFFAELGAEVIKVENPDGGDVTRSWKSAGEISDDCSAYFSCCNWGKKSVTLNLVAESDRAKLLRLAASADIVIASYKPGDAEKLGVDYASLCKVNTNIIYGQITGYGSGDERVGYDAVIQAESGLMDINGEKDGPPIKLPVAFVDLFAAHQLKEGLLLAIIRRDRTGTGGLVEVSLLDAAIASLANQGTNWLVAGKNPRRQGSSHPNIAPYGDIFMTADGKWIMLAVGSDRQFRDLVSVLGVQKDSPLYSELFLTNEKRVANRNKLVASLQPLISGRESPGLLKELAARKVPVGLIRQLSEAIESAETLVMRSGAAAGLRTLVAQSGFIGKPQLTPPPHLGEHNEEILSGLK